MYTPQTFKTNEPAQLHALMRAWPFALLLTVHEERIEATHLPFMLDVERGTQGTLIAHMARANPHWKCFDGERESLVIFTGPHAYISPSWYEKPTEVPTWNYAVVHAHGRPEIVADKSRVRAILERLVAEHEKHVHPPWSTDQAGEEYVDQQMDHIVAFEMPIERLEGKFKLSQNRSPADRAGVINALDASDRDLDRKTAKLMRRLGLSESN
ncbi:MAG: FMN-binding negative transcriptional regulator [Gammaproteobacteria bacterium]